MGKEVTTISPEGLEVANCYLQFGNIRAVCEYMGVAENQVVEVLNKREVKKYIDSVYLDTTSNGLSYAVEKFKSHELSGHITLIKGERSKVATLASKVL